MNVKFIINSPIASPVSGGPTAVVGSGTGRPISRAGEAVSSDGRPSSGGRSISSGGRLATPELSYAAVTVGDMTPQTMRPAGQVSSRPDTAAGHAAIGTGPQPSTAAGPAVTRPLAQVFRSENVSLFATSLSFRDAVNRILQAEGGSDRPPLIRSAADDFLSRLRSFEGLESLSWNNVHVLRPDGHYWLEIRGSAAQKHRLRLMSRSQVFQTYSPGTNVLWSSFPATLLTHYKVYTTLDVRSPEFVEGDRRMFDRLIRLDEGLQMIRRATEGSVVVYHLSYALGSDSQITSILPYLSTVFGRVIAAETGTNLPAIELRDDVAYSIDDGPRAATRMATTVSQIAGRIRDTGMSSNEASRKRMISAEGAATVCQPQRYYTPRPPQQPAPSPRVARMVQPGPSQVVQRPVVRPPVVRPPVVRPPAVQRPVVRPEGASIESDRRRRMNGLRRQIETLTIEMETLRTRRELLYQQLANLYVDGSEN